MSGEISYASSKINYTKITTYNNNQGKTVLNKINLKMKITYSVCGYS